MKTVKNYFAVMMLMIALLGTSVIYAQELSPIEKERWDMVENTWSLYEQGDYDAFFKKIHDDFVGWDNVNPMPITKAHWMKTAENSKGNWKVVDFNLSLTKIKVFEDGAIVSYYFNYTVSVEKEVVPVLKEVNGREMDYLVKEKGKWYLIGQMRYYE